jgi:predicted DNA-binding antitoxin AbrB/MazE fold protein
MSLTVEAIYENGMLRPTEQLPLKEHERVQITIVPKANWVQQTYGICGWKSTHEELEQILAETEEFEDLP